MLPLLSGALAAGAVALTGRRRAPRLRLPRRRAVPTAGAGSTPAAGPAGVAVPIVLTAAILAGIVGAPVGLVGAGAAAAVVCVIGVGRRRRARARDRIERAVPDAVFAIAAELRGGRPPGVAVQAASESSPPLAPVLRAAASAAPGGLAAALREQAELTGSGGLRALAAILAVADTGGAAVAAILDGLGEALDDDLAARAHLTSVLSGPRATATLLAGLPVLGLLLGQAVGAHPAALLLHRPLGWALGAAAGLLDLGGVIWTQRIVRSAGRP